MADRAIKYFFFEWLSNKTDKSYMIFFKINIFINFIVAYKDF